MKNETSGATFTLIGERFFDRRGSAQPERYLV
jgi:hypothetical protein